MLILVPCVFLIIVGDVASLTALPARVDGVWISPTSGRLTLLPG